MRFAPFRIDPEMFEAGIRKRLENSSDCKSDPLEGMSPALRYASSFLPLQILSGGKITDAALNVAPATGLAKFTGVLLMPAISVFVLVGTVVLSVLKIRSIQLANDSQGADQPTQQGKYAEWNCHFKWFYWVPLVLMLLPWFGATWLLFLILVFSNGVLIYVLRSLAQQGIGNRAFVGQTCSLGLMLIGQACFTPEMRSEIHFVDQSLIGLLFMCAMLGLAAIGVGYSRGRPSHEPAIVQWTAHLLFLLFLSVPVAVLVVLHWPSLKPITHRNIKDYVESFHEARFRSVSWKSWSTPAKWAIERGLEPDLTKPRELLAIELSKANKDSTILNVAMDVGLIDGDRVLEWPRYQTWRTGLIRRSQTFSAAYPISPYFEATVIRAAVLLKDLTDEERASLELRLNATLQAQLSTHGDELENRLVATHMLQLIGRPANPDQYRESIHGLLLKMHVKPGRNWNVAGGFSKFEKHPSSDLESTANAIELMKVYGVPQGLDLNWIRSYLKSTRGDRIDRQCFKAVLRDRLERLTGVEPPSWLDILYYERNLFAACVLVGMCFYATFSSPAPHILSRKND